MNEEQKKKEIISEYFRGLSRKSHDSVKSKYGKDYYKNISNKRWAKYREAKKDKPLDTK